MQRLFTLLVTTACLANPMKLNRWKCLPWLWLLALNTSAADSPAGAEPNQHQRLVRAVRAVELRETVSTEGKTLFQISISRSDTAQYLASWGQGKLTVTGASLMEILSRHCLDLSPLRIIPESPLPAGHFDLVVQTRSLAQTPPQQAETVRTHLRQAVETTFGLSLCETNREMEVFVLRVTNSNPKHLSATLTHSGVSTGHSPGKLTGVNWSVPILILHLETILRKPVLDETGLTARYDLELNWDPKEPDYADPGALTQALREQLGLELSPAKRLVQVYFVRTVRH